MLHIPVLRDFFLGSWIIGYLTELNQIKPLFSSNDVKEWSHSINYERIAKETVMSVLKTLLGFSQE